jgi:hypothetical protein
MVLGLQHPRGKEESAFARASRSGGGIVLKSRQINDLARI